MSSGETVRHRAGLVAVRSGLKAQVHAVLAKQGVAVPMTDLFGVGGQELLDKVWLDPPYRARVDSLRRVVDQLDWEIDRVHRRVTARLAGDPALVAPVTGRRPRRRLSAPRPDAGTRAPHP